MMNNRLVITSENFTTYKTLLVRTQSIFLFNEINTHPHSWLCSAWTTWYQYYTAHNLRSSSSPSSPRPWPPCHGCWSQQEGIHYPLSTQKSSSNLFYAYLLVKNLSFADTQTILSSVFVASLTDLWSSYEFEAAVVCPVFYCEYLSLIDISSVFVILY